MFLRESQLLRYRSSLLQMISDLKRSLTTFQLSVPVAFFASDHEAFSDCAGFPYDFQLNDLRTFSVVSKGPLVPQESANSACTTISLVN